MQIQKCDDHHYENGETPEIAFLLGVYNPPFMNSARSDEIRQRVIARFGASAACGVRDITVKNVRIYCDEELISAYGRECVNVKLRNQIPGAQFRNVTVKDVFLNGKKLFAEEMHILTVNCVEDALAVE